MKIISKPRIPRGRILVIYDCSECPHLYGYKCAHPTYSDGYREIPAQGIPRWCPLPKATKGSR